jgi:thiamine-phosphate diphosphorylase
MSSGRRVEDAIRGFYAVLDRDDERLARTLARASRVLQVRLKPRDRRIDTATLVAVAQMARRVCDETGTALIVNDRLDVALAVGADGVHLGQTDLPLAEARRIAGSLWIGISTHDREQVRAARAAGADYLGFGPVFATTTKQDPDPVQGLTGLRMAVAEAGPVPVVAIGGITPETAPALYRLGVAAICAIGAVNDAPDVLAVASRLTPPPIANDSEL